eukprot:scaffold1471_cov413-Prasinococcus_capsulatus_cf.AAC.5
MPGRRSWAARTPSCGTVQVWLGLSDGWCFDICLEEPGPALGSSAETRLCCAASLVGAAKAATAGLKARRFSMLKQLSEVTKAARQAVAEGVNEFNQELKKEGASVIDSLAKASSTGDFDRGSRPHALPPSATSKGSASVPMSLDQPLRAGPRETDSSGRVAVTSRGASEPKSEGKVQETARGGGRAKAKLHGKRIGSVGKRKEQDQTVKQSLGNKTGKGAEVAPSEQEKRPSASIGEQGGAKVEDGASLPAQEEMLARLRVEKEDLELSAHELADKLEEQMSGLAGKVEAGQGEISALKEENRKMEIAYQEVQDVLDRTTRSKDQLSAKLGEKEDALSKAVEEVEQFRSLLRSKEIESRELQSAHDRARDALSNAEQASDHVLSLERRVEEVDAARKAAEDAAREVQDRLNEQSKIADEARESSAAAHQARLAAEKLAHEYEVEALKAKTAMEEAKKLSEEMRLDGERRAKTFQAALKSGVANAQSELLQGTVVLEQRISLLESEVAELSQANESLQESERLALERLHEESSKLAGLQETLQESEQKLSSMEDEKGRVLNEMESLLSTKEHEIQSLQGRVGLEAIGTSTLPLSTFCQV